MEPLLLLASPKSSNVPAEGGLWGTWTRPWEEVEGGVRAASCVGINKIFVSSLNLVVTDSERIQQSFVLRTPLTSAPNTLIDRLSLLGSVPLAYMGIYHYRLVTLKWRR